MTKGKKIEKTSVKSEDAQTTEKTVSLKETADTVVSSFKSFTEACKKLEGKSDNETFALSIKGLQKKVNRLHNKAQRNDILKALREGKTVIVSEA